MAWIESHDDIWEHHKTLKLISLLGLPDVQVVGHLMSLWHFVLRNAWRDANLAPWGDEGIERAARWRGKAGVFVKALRAAGYMDGTEVHGWSERAGRLVYDRFRKEDERLSAVKRRTIGGQSKATVPNRTQPYPTKPNKRITAPKKARDPQPPKPTPKTGEVEILKPLTPIQIVMRAFQLCKGFTEQDLDGPRGKDWNKKHFNRYARAAADLINACGGDYRIAVDFMGLMGEEWNDIPDWGLEAIARAAGRMPDKIERLKDFVNQEDGEKNGPKNIEVGAARLDGPRRAGGTASARDLAGDALNGLHAQAPALAGPAEDQLIDDEPFA